MRSCPVFLSYQTRHFVWSFKTIFVSFRTGNVEHRNSIRAGCLVNEENTVFLNNI